MAIKKFVVPKVGDVVRVKYDPNCTHDGFSPSNNSSGRVGTQGKVRRVRPELEGTGDPDHAYDMIDLVGIPGFFYLHELQVGATMARDLEEKKQQLLAAAKEIEGHLELMAELGVKEYDSEFMKIAIQLKETGLKGKKLITAAKRLQETLNAQSTSL